MTIRAYSSNSIYSIRATVREPINVMNLQERNTQNASEWRDGAAGFAFAASSYECVLSYRLRSRINIPNGGLHS
jgi:hypothetical protein